MRNFWIGKKWILMGVLMLLLAGCGRLEIEIEDPATSEPTAKGWVSQTQAVQPSATTTPTKISTPTPDSHATRMAQNQATAQAVNGTIEAMNAQHTPWPSATPTPSVSVEQILADFPLEEGHCWTYDVVQYAGEDLSLPEDAREVLFEGSMQQCIEDSWPRDEELVYELSINFDPPELGSQVRYYKLVKNGIYQWYHPHFSSRSHKLLEWPLQDDRRWWWEEAWEGRVFCRAARAYLRKLADVVGVKGQTYMGCYQVHVGDGLNYEEPYKFTGTFCLGYGFVRVEEEINDHSHGLGHSFWVMELVATQTP